MIHIVDDISEVCYIETYSTTLFLRTIDTYHTYSFFFFCNSRHHITFFWGNLFLPIVLDVNLAIWNLLRPNCQMRSVPWVKREELWVPPKRLGGEESTPLKINMEPKNHPIEKWTSSSKRCIFRFHRNFSRVYGRWREVKVTVCINNCRGWIFLQRVFGFFNSQIVPLKFGISPMKFQVFSIARGLDKISSFESVSLYANNIFGKNRLVGLFSSLGLLER